MNSVRAAIHARRDEIAIMQLVGAPRWMVRGPFVVEGAITGALAGVFAGATTFGLAAAAIGLGPATFSQFAPGVTIAVAGAAAGMVVAAGLALGSGSSLLTLRRHMES
jgi:cell division transport system permease protein